MTKLAIFALCALLSVPALAQDRGPGGFGRNDRDDREDRRQPRYGFSDMHGKRYVNIGAEVCGVTEVRIHVEGDNLTINDLDLLFGDGSIQDIRLRNNFAPGQVSRWIRLAGGPRCVKGLFIDASGDNDRRNAAVTLQARIPTQYNYPVNISEPILVRDNFFRRGRK